MRFRLIILFTAISFSASAQWLHINLHFRKHPVLAAIKPVNDHSVNRIKVNTQPAFVDVKPYTYGETQFNLEAQEMQVMKKAKHNMSWRIYNEASYNFSDLAQLYIKLHRYSEAKWYLLQSNNLSRQENDDRHTITNLVSLAIVKADIGDATSAHSDLDEAHTLARNHNMTDLVTLVEKEMQLLDENKLGVAKAEIKYAETAGNGKNSL